MRKIIGDYGSRPPENPWLKGISGKEVAVFLIEYRRWLRKISSWAQALGKEVAPMGMKSYFEDEEKLDIIACFIPGMEFGDLLSEAAWETFLEETVTDFDPHDPVSSLLASLKLSSPVDTSEQEVRKFLRKANSVMKKVGFHPLSVCDQLVPNIILNYVVVRAIPSSTLRGLIWDSFDGRKLSSITWQEMSVMVLECVRELKSELVEDSTPDDGVLSGATGDVAESSRVSPGSARVLVEDPALDEENFSEQRQLLAKGEVVPNPLKVGKFLHAPAPA